MKPQRIQLSRRKGFNLQEHSRAINGLEAVKVDRSTEWCNPFRVSEHGTRKECAEGFRNMCHGYLSFSGPEVSDQLKWIALAKKNIEKLRGKNLACSCPLPRDGEPDLCHAAVLLEIANQ